MPKKLEDHMKHEVETNPKYKHLSEDRKNAIIYSVLRKSGWKPGKGSFTPSVPADEAGFKNYKEALSKEEKALADELLFHSFKELK